MIWILCRGSSEYDLGPYLGPFAFLWVLRSHFSHFDSSIHSTPICSLSIHPAYAPLSGSFHSLSPLFPSRSQRFNSLFRNSSLPANHSGQSEHRFPSQHPSSLPISALFHSHSSMLNGSLKKIFNSVFRGFTARGRSSCGTYTPTSPLEFLVSSTTVLPTTIMGLYYGHWFPI